MSLFDVPGWSIPAALATSRVSKKRKRSGSDVHSPEGRRVIKTPGPSVTKTRQSEKRKRVGANVSLKRDSTTTKPAKKSLAEERESSPKSRKSKPGRSNDKPSLDNVTTTSSGLTTLQKGMKQSLDGARFRWINEVLYKIDSTVAQKMMHDDPKVYSDYHIGFRHQVHAWPVNPVSQYTSQLSSYPPRTVIADLGCGDAALARALNHNGMTVLSFDLVSDGAYVVEADICGMLPLPGSEGTEEDTEGEGQVVDVVVCALSLMGTNWPHCIREAWRILKPGGELKVAEVASRFQDVDQFTSLICSIGFRLVSKDDSNSHFTSFEWKKVPRRTKTQTQWAKLLSKGHLLKPCEYKRR